MSNDFCGLHGLLTKKLKNYKSEGQPACSFHVKFNSA